MGRLRVALGLVSAAVSVVLCVVLVEKYVLRAEWWQVRHTVTGEPVTPQREVGPPPGPLAVSWERTTPTHHGAVAGYDGVSYQVALGQVVTASGNGIEVRDARTGADRWSYRRSGWTMLGWTSTRSRLVAYFERDGERADRVMVAFDALSGGLLWRREGERPAAVSRSTLRWPGGSDIVLTTDDADRTLFGVSAVTGKRVWRLALPRGCRLFEGGAHPADGREALAAFGLDCREDGRRRSRLLAVDPAKGTVAWDERLGSKESPEVSMLDGITLVSDGTALRAFDGEGDQFGMWKGDGVCGDLMCPGVLAAGRLLVVYHPEGSRSDATRMEAVDVPSGRVAWGRDVPAYVALAQAGGQVFALRPRLSEGLLPAGVDIVEPSGGGTATAPAPFSMDPDLPGARPWLAAAGGLLYAAVPQAAPRPDGAARLVALRGGLTGAGPAELGGVPAADWPDACSLLTAPDLAAARMTGYAAEPHRESAGTVRLPRPVSCSYERRGDGRRGDGRDEPKSKGDRKGEKSASPTTKPEPKPTSSPSPSASGSSRPKPSASTSEDAEPPVRGLTVSVRWVGETDEAAARMLDALQAAQSQARKRRDIGGDEAYEIGPTAGMIALRVGRYVVVVEASRPPGAAARIARSVAYRLHHPA
ncbi:PQQ-binding-like beta-propeller repeat protein [Actinomadura sp. NAK00032]|uniref:outer membrane protein assembly factor BamB family protein n=1 Tax=Actinomadura sp. NAK00032 TaxID=2742128 RepID=UPI0015916F3F|nr:PQQ-binding-like beta-propeller repeat protein [Actinomadura sp. NAK00032]QKW39046.1 PQQ-binding-like beta-propeller repeat protein [Actinomadura sp. NAK00032]